MCVCVCSRTCVLSTSIVSSSTTGRNAAVTSIPVLPTFHRIPLCTQQGVIGLCSCHETHFCFFFPARFRFQCHFVPSAAHLNAMAHLQGVRYSPWKSYSLLRHSKAYLRSFQVCIEPCVVAEIRVGSVGFCTSTLDYFTQCWYEEGGNFELTFLSVAQMLRRS